METVAKGRTSQALDKLMDLQPSEARLVENYPSPSNKTSKNELPISKNSLKIRAIDSRYVQIHDVIEVMRGSKISVDGIVIAGASSVDESLITGIQTCKKYTLK